MKSWLHQSKLLAILMLVVNLFIVNVLSGQTTYTWQGANNASWALGTNWTPTRTTPAANDILQFSSGTTLNITAVPTQTIGRFVMSGNTSITLQSSGTVTLTIGNGAGTDLDIQSGSTLVIGGSNSLTVTLATSATADIAGTLTVNNGRTYNTNGTTVVTTVTGTLNDAGDVVCTTASKLLVNSGATYNYNQDGGTIPTATWNSASNFNVTGWGGSTGAPGGITQSFGNFRWNSTGQTGNLSLAGGLNTVNGNFTISSTGSGSLSLGGTGTGNLTIGGDYSQTGGTFSGSSSAARTVTVNGDFSLTGGTLNLSSSGTSGNAVTISVAGDFTHSAGTLNETGSTTGSGIIFPSGAHTYTSGGTLSGVVNFTVNNGATLQMGTGASPATISNGSSGNFTLSSGATLGVTSTAGITTTGATGNIQVTGTRTYASGASFIYNGNANQVCGNGLTQNTTANLTINNPNTVTLSAATTITGNLLISQGTLSASGSNFNLSVGGNWTNNGVGYSGGTSTVTFTGTTGNITGTSSTTFPNLAIDGASATAYTILNNNSASSLSFNTGGFASSLTHSGSSSLTVNGSVVISEPTANVVNSWNINAGSATVSGNVTLGGTTNNTARISRIVITSGSLGIDGNLVLTTSATAGNQVTSVVDMSTGGGGGTLTLGGALTLTNGLGTLSPGTNSTVIYDGASGQTVTLASAVTYNNLKIDNTSSGGANAGATITASNVTGNLSVGSINSGSTFGNGGNAITLASAKNFSVANGSTFNLTGTTTMVTVSGGGTKTFGSTSTVNYGGAAQNVTVESYGNLSLSGSANKTFAGSTTIAGALSVSTSAVAILPNGSTSSAATLLLNGNGQPSGSWGGSTSAATNKSSTFFGSSTTGIINIASGSCTTGTWLGNTSIDWNTASNWCGNAIPTSSTDVVIPSGTAFAPTIQASTSAVCRNLTINSGATLTLANSASALLNISGDLANNGTITSGAAAVVSFNGTAAQSIGGSSTSSFSNLTISNNSAAVSVNTNINVSGTMNLGSGAILNPAAAVVINNAAAAGTITGSGTINVTRTTATADYSNQYKFSTNTLGSLTVDYAGTGAQNINSFTYGNLRTSGSGTKTLTTSGPTISGAITIGSGTTLDAVGFTTTVTTGLTVNGTLDFTNAAGLFRTAATGTVTVTMGTNGVIRTNDDNGLGPVANASLQIQGSGVWDLSSVSTSGTIEYYRNATSGQTVTDRDYNNLIITGTSQTKTWTIGATRTINGTVTINGNLTLSGAQTINVLGDWTKTAGTFNAGTSTINFSGSAAQLINGSSATTFNNLTINKSVAANTVTSQTTAFTTGALTVTTGNLVLLATNAGYTVNGDLNVAANGTLTHNVDWATGFALTAAGNIAIDGAYSIGTAPRAHVTMTGTSKNVRIPNSAFNIFTIAAGASVTANGSVTANDNFWAPIGAGGSFNTGGQTITANASLLVSGGTLTINGGTVNVSGGFNIGQNGSAGTVSHTSGSLITDGITIGDASAAGTGTYTQSSGTTATVNGAVTINQQTNNTTTNAWNLNAGTATVSGLITFAGTNATASRVGTIVLSTGTLNANGGITFAGTTAANKIINLGTTGTVNMKGALTNAANATLTAGTSGSTFNYNDNTTAQTVNYFGAGAYHNLHINTTGGAGASLIAAISATNVTGNLRVQSGTLSNGGFGIVGNAARTLEVANGAFLLLGGTTSGFPTAFGTVSLGATSTVDYRGSGAQTISAQNYGNLTTTLNGTRTITLANSGTIGIAGVFSPAGGTTSYTNTGSTVSFNGTTGSQNIPAFAFNNLTINNTSDVALTGAVSVNGTTNALTFTNGKINTGANTLTLASGVTVTTAGAGKYVNGKLAWVIPTGTPSRTFFVGDATNYTPALITFTTTITVGGTITVNTTSGDHPNIGTSAINPAKSVNRYWTIANTTVSPVGYSATFTYINPGDLDAGVNTANVETQRWVPSTWSNTTAGTRTSTTVQATGISAFGDFQCGETCTPPVINTPSVTNVSCNGGSDGAIDISTTGGSSPFTYAWTGPGGFTANTEDITGLEAGNYSLLITATGGCTVSSGTITVTEPPVLNAIVNSTDVTCFGASNGTITISSPTGGYGTYEYTIDGGGSWQPTGSYTSLGATGYTVQIRDAAHIGCVVTLDPALFLNEPGVLSATLNSTGATCNNLTDGTITISAPSGGNGTYEYSINGGGSWQASGNYTSLTTATVYNVRIRDAAVPACVVILNGSLSLTNPGVLNATVTPTNLTCNSAGNGAISITSPTGGYGTYEYSINGGGSWQGSGSFTALAAATYDVRIRDAAHPSCQVTLNGSLTLTEPAALAAPTSGGNQAVCTDGTPTQTLTATATSPFAIIWYDAASGGNIVSPPTQVGPGTVTYYAEANDGQCSSLTRTAVTLTINVPTATPGSITGPTDVCPLVGLVTPSTYSISPVSGATTYTWVVPVGTTIVSGQGTTSINVTFDNSFALTNSQFKVSTGNAVGCTSAQSTLIVLKNVPAIPATIFGPTDACPFTGQPTTATYSIDPVTYATDYTWSVSGNASIISGQGSTSIEVSFASNYTAGNVKVTANSNCGSRSPRQISIGRLIPSVPVAINGPTDACSYIGTLTQVNYTIDPVPNATSYTWTVPANVTLVSGQGSTSIFVRFNTGFLTSNIKVKAVSNCFTTGDKQLAVYGSTYNAPGVISGPTNACAFIGTPNDATYTIRKVANAPTYLWTVPAGATITSHPGGFGSANDTIITVSYDNSFVSGTAILVQSAGCVTSTARSITINRLSVSTPGLITGPTNVCEYMESVTNPSGTTAVYKINKVANATSYTWTPPSNATITGHPGGAGVNDTIINVIFNSSFTTGSFIVTATNACGTSGQRTLAVTRLSPSTPSPIDIIQTVACPSREYTYTISSIPNNTTSLVWTYPVLGTLISGQGTTSITVSYPPTAIAGAVTVTALNNCDASGTRSVTIKLPACSGPREANNSTVGLKGTVLENTPGIQVNVYPNPTVTDFKVQVLSPDNQQVTVRILDMQGRELKRINTRPGQLTSIGKDLHHGNYIMEVIQGDKRNTQKLIKL